jgi:hypothetical protein
MKFVKVTHFKDFGSQQSLDAYIASPEYIYLSPLHVIRFEPHEVNLRSGYYCSHLESVMVFIAYGDRVEKILIGGSAEDFADKLFQA